MVRTMARFAAAASSATSPPSSPFGSEIAQDQVCVGDGRLGAAVAAAETDHLLQRDALLKVSVRIVARVRMVLDRDRGKLCFRGAVRVHVQLSGTVRPKQAS